MLYKEACQERSSRWSSFQSQIACGDVWQELILHSILQTLVYSSDRDQPLYHLRTNLVLLLFSHLSFLFSINLKSFVLLSSLTRKSKAQPGPFYLFGCFEFLQTHGKVGFIEGLVKGEKWRVQGVDLYGTSTCVGLNLLGQRVGDPCRPSPLIIHFQLLSQKCTALQVLEF